MFVRLNTRLQDSEPGSEGGAPAAAAEPQPGDVGQQALDTRTGAEPKSTEPQPGDPTPPEGGDWNSTILRYSKGDEKLTNRLSRFSSPEALIDSYLNAEKKISSGQLKAALPENPTPEQLADWRSQNGIPDSVDGYEVNLPEDLQLDDDGKAFIEAFKQDALDQNLPPTAVDSVLGTLFKMQQEGEKAIEAEREAHRVQAQQQLMEEWGADYNRNSQIAKNFLDSAPEVLKNELLDYTGPNGMPLSQNVEFMRWITNMAFEKNPMATVVPGSGEQAIANIQNELGALKVEMAKSKQDSGPNDYWNNPAKQERYRKLISAQSKYNG
jgi:hypothetical protein